MRTNIVIDDELMREAMVATGAKTKREAVQRALEKVVRGRRQASMLELRGIGWDGDLEATRLD